MQLMLSKLQIIFVIKESYLREQSSITLKSPLYIFQLRFMIMNIRKFSEIDFDLLEGITTYSKLTQLACTPSDTTVNFPKTLF